MNKTSIFPILIGPMKNIAYVIFDKFSHKAAIVDPAWDLSKLYHQINMLDAEISLVLITHAHFDHVNKLNELLNKCDVPVVLSQKTTLQLDHFNNYIQVKENEVIKLGNTQITILETPGHSPDGLCFLINNESIISGDTLFVNGCGRCDLNNSSPLDMFQSLAKIKRLNKDLTVYPGHQYAKNITSSIMEQIKLNPYLNCKDYDSFFKMRMKK